PAGENLRAHAAAECPGAQHLLPRGDGLIEHCGLDLAVQLIIGAHVGLIGLADITVAQVLSQGVEGGTVAKRYEARESSAALMGAESPATTLVVRHPQPAHQAVHAIVRAAGIRNA